MDRFNRGEKVVFDSGDWRQRKRKDGPFRIDRNGYEAYHIINWGDFDVGPANAHVVNAQIWPDGRISIRERMARSLEL